MESGRHNAKARMVPKPKNYKWDRLIWIHYNREYERLRRGSGNVRTTWINSTTSNELDPRTCEKVYVSIRQIECEVSQSGKVIELKAGG